MSWLSSLLHKSAGLPEINLANNPTIGPIIDPLIAALESEIVTNKLPTILMQFPQHELDAGAAAFNVEQARRKATSTTPGA